MTSSAPYPLTALLLPRPRALCLFAPSVCLFAADRALLLPVYEGEQVEATGVPCSTALEVSTPKIAPELA